MPFFLEALQNGGFPVGVLPKPNRQWYLQKKIGSFKLNCILKTRNFFGFNSCPRTLQVDGVQSVQRVVCGGCLDFKARCDVLTVSPRESHFDHGKVTGPISKVPQLQLPSPETKHRTCTGTSSKTFKGPIFPCSFWLGGRQFNFQVHLSRLASLKCFYDDSHFLFLALG